MHSSLVALDFFCPETNYWQRLKYVKGQDYFAKNKQIRLNC